MACDSYSSATFVRNNIAKNALSGVVVTRKANPTFKNNVVSENKRFGIHIADSGRGVYEGNEVCKNFEAGVRIESNASPLLDKVHLLKKNVGLALNVKSGYRTHTVGVANSWASVVAGWYTHGLLGAHINCHTHQLVHTSECAVTFEYQVTLESLVCRRTASTADVPRASS